MTNPWGRRNCSISSGNTTAISNIKFIALGGINEKNIRKLRIVNSKSFAMMSELEKEPKYLER